jgi:prolipoprotein diacylglyceryltransferase
LWNQKKGKTPAGLLTGIFMIFVFTLRFFYEFLKENQSSFENGLTLNMGQILSIPAVLFGIGVLWYAKRKA